MKIPKQLVEVFSPPAEQTQHGTGLTFTDILFGFVITQIFLRLQHWSDLTTFSRWQLGCTTALVLGSWIGFRRSRNRSEYELKFFNLPLFRFLLDQTMLVLYFRIATLTPTDPDKSIDTLSVAHDTIRVLALIFALYLFWDLLGQVMGGSGKYPNSDTDFWSPLITFVWLVSFIVLWRVIDTADSFDASLLLGISTGLLIAYRWAKDIRSTRRGKNRSREPRRGQVSVSS